VKALAEYLQSGADHNLLPLACQLAAAEQFHMSPAEVEGVALALGLMPARYQRNQQTITAQNQLTLFRSRVAVIGCGGLGGYVIEELARLGVGTLIAIDHDIFQEHNLNRQILSTTGSLGRAKVEMAAERVAQINPATTLLPVHAPYTPEDARELLAGAEVVVDALDSISTRLALAKSCSDLGLPLVHGAIAGWYGHVCTLFPGDQSLQLLYGRSPQERGGEQSLGNPSFTPAVVASIECAEVCKLLLGVGSSLHRRCLLINLFDMTFEEIALPYAGEQETGCPPMTTPSV
jgi:molybdopterin-synthase adenylyltransferase